MISSGQAAAPSTTALPPPPSPSLSPTIVTLPSLRFLQASKYPRKKDGSLYSPRFQPASPRPSTTNAVVVGRSAPVQIPNRPLPTPPSSEPSSFSDTEPFSSDNHLGSFPSLLAFFASERRILKERDRERRRSAAVDKAARRETRRRATLRYPKSHDLTIKDILAREQRKKDEQEQEGQDGADEAADDEDGPVLRSGSVRLSFASMQISSTSSSRSSRSSRGTFIDGRSSSFDQDWPSTPPSPPRTSSTTTTPSPLSSSFTPVVSRRQRAVKKKLSPLPLTSLSVPTSPTTTLLRLPSAKPKPNPKLLPFTLLDPSTPPPPSPTGPVSQLRYLAEKLIERFPEDKDGIEMQLKLEQSIASGEEPTKGTREDASPLNQVHVFVDHSNILVGLLQQPISPSPHHRQPHSTISHLHPTHHNPFPPPHHHHHYTSATHLPPKSTFSTSPPSPIPHFLNPAPTLSRHPQLQTLSHPSLALLLLRGREAKTKALVASSPLHQPLSDLQIPARGPWDVAVLRRVKQHELYEGMNPDAATTTSGSEAEGGGSAAATRKARRKQQYHSSRRTSFAGGFKEQAVDELLQLKILQTILRHDSPSRPTSAQQLTNTLILATGDCAGSPLNPGGFRECVEVALGKGWNVEVWGWRRGIGEGWRELERAAWRTKKGGRMVVRELDEWEPYLRGGEGW